MRTNPVCCTAALIFLSLSVVSARPPKQSAGPVTPVRTSTQRGGYTIETVGDTLGQAPAQNTRIIIRVVGSDQKLLKPGQIALVDKGGTAMKPVFREDRKAGHEENTGLPVSLGSQGAGLDLHKLLGPHGTYAYTKVDWPKDAFTADKSLQIVLPNGQNFLIPVSSLAK